MELSEAIRKAELWTDEKQDTDGVVLSVATIRALLIAAQSQEPKNLGKAPKDTAVLVYEFGFSVAHFNTALGAWVRCHDHAPCAPFCWWPLPALPPQEYIRR